jgi:hypothetical protein
MPGENPQLQVSWGGRVRHVGQPHVGQPPHQGRTCSLPSRDRASHGPDRRSLLPYALSATKWRGYDPGWSHHPPHCWYRLHKAIVQVPGPPPLEALRQELGTCPVRDGRAVPKRLTGQNLSNPSRQAPRGYTLTGSQKGVPPRCSPLGDENEVRPRAAPTGLSTDRPSRPDASVGWAQVLLQFDFLVLRSEIRCIFQN